MPWVIVPTGGGSKTIIWQDNPGGAMSAGPSQPPTAPFPNSPVGPQVLAGQSQDIASFSPIFQSATGFTASSPLPPGSYPPTVSASCSLSNPNLLPLSLAFGAYSQVFQNPLADNFRFLNMLSFFLNGAPLVNIPVTSMFTAQTSSVSRCLTPYLPLPNDGQPTDQDVIMVTPIDNSGTTGVGGGDVQFYIPEIVDPNVPNQGPFTMIAKLVQFPFLWSSVLFSSVVYNLGDVYQFNTNLTLRMLAVSMDPLTRTE